MNRTQHLTLEQSPPPTRQARILWLALGMLALVSIACSLGGVEIEPTSTPKYPPVLAATMAPIGRQTQGECLEPGQPTDADIQEALNFTGMTFGGSEWERSYNVLSDRVTVTWMNETEGALAYLENLVYDCGYTQADMDIFFSEQNLKEVILKDYEQPELIKMCSTAFSDLRLYEMSAWIHEQTYLVRIWVTLTQPNRMVYVFLTFPEVVSEQLESYAGQVFPQLPACD